MANLLKRSKEDASLKRVNRGISMRRNRWRATDVMVDGLGGSRLVKNEHGLLCVGVVLSAILWAPGTELHEHALNENWPAKWP